jgi:hypothetical protein
VPAWEADRCESRHRSGEYVTTREAASLEEGSISHNRSGGHVTAPKPTSLEADLEVITC